ncbi:hypothetical protein Val02_52160 [Virgisporangium aliadipatigenens]|uniref:Uncharacterized protein n=1 Tax=Virgisporangium aliadipatigenens TaxID=741659 RepID=A0A8J3YQV6_9ACTN|nr:macro domain-containing protein [Virgisporangium aliadipatigenens]GIJ48330.1 hypothetical protein Val02_52160 [Virgisporangium aliadipatigenens]
MPRVRIFVLGRFAVEVDGRAVRLPPLTARMLIRLVRAGPQPTSTDRLYRDVWEAGAPGTIRRPHRTLVQRRISELRRLLDPSRPGDGSVVILTEASSSTAYRLDLAATDVDLWHFRQLASADGRSAEETLKACREALRLWPDGAPLQLGEEPEALRLVARLAQDRAALRERLLDAHLALGRYTEARTLAEEMLAERPDDPHALAARGEIARRDASMPRVLLRHRLARRGTILHLAVGDLFALRHADLVIGFTDTFDTSTHDDRIISAASMQGQLLRRIYGNDRGLLDRHLRRALRDEPHVAREERADKPAGKLIRYALGTVAVVRERDRRIFCVAYSRMGNDFVARSSPEHLAHSLDRVWEAAHRHGQFAELAMPLVGSGRSRLDTLDLQDLLEMIVRSFVRACADNPVCRELWIVLSEFQSARIDPDALARALDRS